MPQDLADKRLLIAAGGTGGHVYPGIAVAEEWTRQGGKVAFIGVPERLEGRVVPEAGYQFFPMRVRGFTRGTGLRATMERISAAGLLITLAPLRQAVHAVRLFQPDVVLGVGGYVSGPALLAARILRIPTMILQLDALPGIANRVASQFATTIGVSLPESAARFRRRSRVRIVGNPIRQEVLSASRADGLRSFGLDPNRHTLLVFGGSLGSGALNEALVGALLQLPDRWRAGWQVLHITGRASATPSDLLPEESGVSYQSMEYCDRMPLALAASDMVVSRAGATTVAELTARGIPAIVAPWSGAADNHQEGNARALERAGAAVVVLDGELSAESLCEKIEQLTHNPEGLARMAAASRALGARDAAQRVTEELALIARSPAPRPTRRNRPTPPV